MKDVTILLAVIVQRCLFCFAGAQGENMCPSAEELLARMQDKYDVVISSGENFCSCNGQNIFMPGHVLILKYNVSDRTRQGLSTGFYSAVAFGTSENCG